MRDGFPRLTGILAGAVLILGLVGCGSDSGAADSETVTEAATEAVDGQATAAPPEAPADAAEDDVASADSSIVLGFEISGPAGTIIETTTVAVANATEQPELDQTWQLTGEPKGQLFTPFVDAAVMTLKVAEGGPAKVMGFRGSAKDANDPTAGYDVAEELSTVELERGKIAVLSLP